jgi:hypothetical protein
MDLSSRIPRKKVRALPSQKRTCRSRRRTITTANPLLPLVDAIDKCIIRLNQAQLWETAELLRMARLDLAARANGISEEELELFVRMLSDRYAVAAGEASAAKEG